MSRNKSNAQLTYTPEAMESVLKEALTPTPTTPLLSQPQFYSIVNTIEQSDSSEYEVLSNISSSSDEETASQAVPKKQRQSLPGKRGMTGPKLGLTPPTLLPSPVRPSPNQPRHTDGTPEQLFEVEHSFLKAVVGLLERQANIQPTSTLTKSDVKTIARREITAYHSNRHRMSYPTSNTALGLRPRLAASIQPKHLLLGAAVGAVANLIYCAWKLNPKVVKMLSLGMLAGGMAGYAGAGLAKAVCMAIDWLSDD